jgi:uroporphyrinogen decarboxylase
MLAAYAYENPDKIPVVYSPSAAGVHVHGQKLIDLFNQYPPDNPIRFDSIPGPDPEAVGKDGRYHEIRKDEWGTTWEYRVFGIHGHPLSYPFNSWVEAKDYEFPPLPVFDKAELAKQRKQFLVSSGWVSIFEKLHALRPMGDVLMDLLDEDEDCMAFLDRLVDYRLATVQTMLDAGIDTIVFADDWGTQTAPLMSPSFFREVYKPRYKKLMDPVKKAGRRVFFHCCGLLAGIFDELLDLGIDGFWPQITLFDADPANTIKCRDHNIAIYIHPDRQRLIPQGTPAEIDAVIKGYAEKYHKLGGGGIFHIEMENDAPFENVKALIEAVHRYR